MSASSLLNGCKLSYFDIPGRAETLRLALSAAGITFVDHRFGRDEWGTIKSTMPWAQVPMMTLTDGSTLAQSKAMLRLIGKAASPAPLYPLDAMHAFRVDEMIDAIDDLSATIRTTGEKLEGAAKEAARKESCESGPVSEALRRMDEFIAKHGSGGFTVGNSLTIADIALFSQLQNLVSGAYDGVPSTLYAPFAHIQGVRKTVASLPSTVKWYETRGEAKSKAELLNVAARDL